MVRRAESAPWSAAEARSDCCERWHTIAAMKRPLPRCSRSCRTDSRLPRSGSPGRRGVARGPDRRGEQRGPAGAGSVRHRHRHRHRRRLRAGVDHAQPRARALGVTTVSGDAVARARLAAQLLALDGGAAARVPVYAGTSTARSTSTQTEWAAGFTSPALHADGGVAFMRAADRGAPGPADHRRGRRADQRRRAADVVPWHRRQDQAHRADGRRGPTRRAARLDAAARVEHQVERRRGARRCSPSGVPLIVVAARRDRGSQAHTGAPRPHLHPRHADDRRAGRARLRVALHEHVERGDADPVRPAADGRRCYKPEIASLRRRCTSWSRPTA